MEVHLDVDCGCCGDECSSQCQYQSGTATMCGWFEYPGYASVPPKRYHYKNLSGEITRRAYSYGCSGTPDFTCVDVYSGRVTPDYYDGGPCYFLSSESGHVTSNCGNSSVSAINELYPDMCTVSYSSTTKTVVGNNFCHDNGNETNYSQTGTGIETLTEEDTESAAEARAKADITTWSYQTDYSCAGLASFRTVRGDTFSWSWTQVQRRGVTPDYDATMATQAVYRVVLKWYTTATNANGAVVSEGLVELTHSPGWVGDIYTEWADIPIPEAGLFAYAGECRISLVSAGVPRPPNPEET